MQIQVSCKSPSFFYCLLSCLAHEQGFAGVNSVEIRKTSSHEHLTFISMSGTLMDTLRVLNTYLILSGYVTMVFNILQKYHI